MRPQGAKILTLDRSGSHKEHLCVRQQIADSWPESVDDAQARKDWGWLPQYDLASTVETMIEALRKMYPPPKEELKIVD